VEIADVSLLWKQMFELLPQGIIIISRSLKAVYWNQKATHLCNHLGESSFPAQGLPLPVLDVCHCLLRDQAGPGRTWVMEHLSGENKTVRITAQWLGHGNRPPSEGANVDAIARHRRVDPARPSAPSPDAFIAIFLENRDEIGLAELRLQQQKYDLTEREAEIWMLLQQEYSYQEIARLLVISLNTVKTHVKNVYAKRRGWQGQERFWSCE
jgi:DNA-binding CsgD family transcriptional regulator